VTEFGNLETPKRLLRFRHISRRRAKRASCAQRLLWRSAIMSRRWITNSLLCAIAWSGASSAVGLSATDAYGQASAGNVR